MRNRGFRLHQDKRAKAKARAIVKDRLAWKPNAEIKDDDVGKVASVHGAIAHVRDVVIQENILAKLRCKRKEVSWIWKILLTRLSGYSSVWQSARFGNERFSQVRILLSRLSGRVPREPL